MALHTNALGIMVVEYVLGHSGLFTIKSISGPSGWEVVMTKLVCQTAAEAKEEASSGVRDTNKNSCNSLNHPNAAIASHTSDIPRMILAKHTAILQ